jgi:hypothetical protein
MYGLTQIFKLRDDSGEDNMPQSFPLEVRKWLAWFACHATSQSDINLTKTGSMLQVPAHKIYRLSFHSRRILFPLISI